MITDKVITYIMLLFAALVTLFPIMYVVFSSFKSNMEIMSMTPKLLPEVWTLENYKNIFNFEDFNVWLLLKNSIVYTAICVISTLIVSSVTGYVFARGEFPLKKPIETVFLSLMFISFGSITIYPMFELLNLIGLAKSLNGLIVMKVFSLNVVNMQLVKSFVKTLPAEIDESAEIDGCTFTGIFFRIISPLLTPILATIALLSFQGSWNEYLMPTLFTITRPDQQTLIVAIMAMKNSSQAAQSWNIMFAATVISSIPVLILYFCFGKYYVSGLSEGAVKG